MSNQDSAADAERLAELKTRYEGLMLTNGSLTSLENIDFNAEKQRVKEDLKDLINTVKELGHSHEKLWEELVAWFEAEDTMQYILLLSKQERSTLKDLVEKRGIRIARGAMAISFSMVIEGKASPVVSTGEAHGNAVNPNQVHAGGSAGNVAHGNAGNANQDGAGNNAGNVNQDNAAGNVDQSSAAVTESSVNSNRGYAKSNFAKLYQDDAAKFTGRTNDPWPTYLTGIRMNARATDAQSSDVMSMLHVTLKAGEPAHKFFMSHVANKIFELEEALQVMEKQFFNDAVKNRAHQEFLQLDFAQFRRSKAAANETEANAVNLFVAHAQNLQEQLPLSYQVDGVLRDRLVAAFSTSSTRLQDSFMDSFPATSAEVTNRAVTRASSVIGTDKIVPEAPYVNMLTDYVYRDGRQDGREDSRRRRHGGFRRNHRRRNGDSRRSRNSRDKACWVCGSLSHFARDVHSEDEIRKARGKGKSPFVFAASIEEDLAISMMQAELDVESSSDEEQDDVPSDDKDEVKVNYTISEVPSTGEDYERINAETVAAAEERTAVIVHLGRTHDEDMRKNIEDMERNLSGDEVEFGGVIIDTACVGASAVGQAEYARYCRATGAEYKILPNSSAMVNFGNAQAGTNNGRARSLGKATIRYYLPAADLVFSFDAHVVPNCDMPLLISLNDLRRLRFDVHTLTETLHFEDAVQPLKRNDEGFLVLPPSRNVCLYTRNELQRFHRAYGHAHTDTILRSLEAAGFEELNAETRNTLAEIARACDACQRRATSPQHFILSQIEQDGRYNSVVQADVAHVSDGPFLHLRCKGTRLNAAGFSPTGKLTGKDVWDLIRKLWLECGIGPMQTLQVDQGTNLVASEIQDACNQYGIVLDAIPTECPWRLGGVEMGHQAIKDAYEKIKSDLPRTDKHELMRLAVHAVNSAADENGISPILLVYGTQPRPLPALVSAPLPDHAARIRAARNAQATLEKTRQRRKHNQALNSRPPYPLEIAHVAVPGTEVLAWRKTAWEGPFPVTKSDGADVTILTPNGRVTLERTRVKPYIRPQQSEKQSQTQTQQQQSQAQTQQEQLQAQTQQQQQPETKQQPPPQTPLLGRRDGRDIHIHFEVTTSPDTADVPVHARTYAHKTVVVPEGPGSAERFKASRKAELDGLIAQNCFEIRRRSEVVQAGDRVYGTRFVDAHKNAGTPEQFDKSRLVIQAYDDVDAESILTKSPTISRAGLRTALSLAASLPSHTVRTRDITQAYVNADTNVKRKIICEMPSEMGLGDEFVLVLVRPIYGLPEAGVHWHSTYVRHHEQMGFKGTALDPCFLFVLHQGIPSIICLQVDDSLGIMDAKVAEQEELAAQKFPHKPPKVLTRDNPIFFNGVRISEIVDEAGERYLKMDQEEKLRDMEKFTGDVDEAGMISAKALGLYVSTVCRPDLMAESQLVTLPEVPEFAKRAVSSASDGLRFVKLDLSGPLRVVVFCDAGFATPSQCSSRSQLGFIVVLADENDRCNILHYSSRRCKRVTRSVFAAELFALQCGFDHARAIADQLSEALGKALPVWGVIDSRTVYNTVVRYGNISEKRLSVDVAALREAHLTRALDKLFWAKSANNGSDPLSKKHAPANEVFTALLRNRLIIRAGAWVDRK